MLAIPTKGQKGLEYLRELASGLGWQATTEVAMLWGYFDESGIHDPATGRLVSLTIGGCIAPLEAWERFAPAWQNVLDQFPELDGYFHMTECEAWSGAYDWRLPNGDRDQKRHQALLNGLLDAIIPHVKMFVGYTNVVGSHDETVIDFETAYVKGIVDMIMHGIKEHYTTFEEQQVSWVFAHHEDVRERRIKDYHRILDWAGNRVRDVTVSRPQNLLPLQAADLVVYELARANREGIPMRSPYKRLLQGAKDMRTIFRAGLVPSLRARPS